MTEFMGLAEKVSKFNQQALKHMENQTLNPFSGRFSRSPSPRPKFSKDEYGKPAAGSLTEMRGQRAFSQISREILELCEVIHDMGARRRDSDGDECVIIPFGELFAFYTKISDKVVGLLIAAKKRGFVYFEPEILFQRRDDDVLIALMKPIGEIRNIINRQISASPSPAPLSASEKSSTSPTTSPLAQENKTSSTASSAPADADIPSPSSTLAEPTKEEHIVSSSNAEIAPQQIPGPSVIAETDKTSLLSVPEQEENDSPSEEPAVESEQKPTSEGRVEVEQTSSVAIAEPLIEDKETPQSNETPSTSEGAETVPSTVLPEPEPIPITEIQIEPTVATEEEKSFTEPITSPEEQVLPSLIVNAESDIIPTVSTSTEPVLATSSGEAEETPTFSEEQASHQEEKTEETTLSFEAQASPKKETGEIPMSSDAQVSPKEETGEMVLSSDEQASPDEGTLSSVVQIVPDGNNEQTSSSTLTTTVETEHTLLPSDKSEEVIPPTDKEQTPPSNDTGEKTLA